MAILIQGLEDSPIENIRFLNATIRSTKGVIANHARGLWFENVQITTAKGPVFDFNQVSHSTIKRSDAPENVAEFLQLNGKTSSSITIENADLTGAKNPFVLGEGVKAGAVLIK